LHVLQNDTTTTHVVKVEKAPFKKRFTLELLAEINNNTRTMIPLNTTFSIRSGSNQKLSLKWTPIESGGIREIVYLKRQGG